MDTVLEAQGLHKRYGERVAVQAVSLQVRAGELVALLGPNGAGKSSTVGMVSGLLRPDAGQVRVAGAALDQATDSAKRRIGLVPQEIALFEDLSARTNLQVLGGLYGLDRASATARADALLAWVGLSERAKDKPAHFSGGMKRRLNIAGALMHDPDLILLDEPTAGVDPHSRNAIFELLEQLKRQGKALIYTTHYMEEAERLADRIVIIDHGQVVAEGRLPELLAQLPVAQTLSLQLSAPPDVAALRALPGVLSLRCEGLQLQVGLSNLDLAAAGLLQALAGCGVQQVHSARASLEDVFLSLTGRALRDGEMR
ncbi:ABC-2 type transport system ATP-binding protein [Inhella inkyongensis]|uniref:ABC-2 type transport system ATP-binding protein n=1 Tax=Inhella inkyongensis TaxID=392593 RepID=A0A840S2C6_9BURK|nr:ABC transporter ATP-binding protein [Inhella inkyongensis]MBB5202750.1 ABC-2 type transport system ATP-binding protein [Inhella inkyongensis]